MRESYRDREKNGDGDDSQKTGYQCDACNSCFSLGGFAEAVDSRSIEGARRRSDFDSADGYDGFDGVDGGFDGVVCGFDGIEGDSDGLGGFGGTDGDDGFGFAGLDGLNGLGDRSKQKKTAL